MRSLLRSTALRSAARTPRCLPASHVARCFSVKADAASTHKHKALDPSRLQITKTKQPKVLPKPEELVFGKEFTGKSIDTDNGTGASKKKSSFANQP